MHRHPESNPHFIRLDQQPEEGQHPLTPPSPLVSHPQGQDQWSPPRRPRATPKPQHDGEGQYVSPRFAPVPPLGQQPEAGGPSVTGQYRSPWAPKHHDQDHDPRGMQPPRPPKPRPEKDRGRRPRVTLPPQKGENQDRGPQVSPQHDEQDRHPPQPRRPEVIPPGQPHEHRRRPRVPSPRPTKPIWWFGAVFCALFWIVVFLGGLIVLIVYLVYRPRSPWFEVSTATLNSAYIDADSLLNADLSVLVNFTNPNKKMSVEFSSMIIDLYYGNTLISTQYIEPFSAASLQSRFVNVHMVSSQVRLPLKYSQQLEEQTNSNGIIFQVEGVFRVRSKMGGLLQYSYWLYAHCSIKVTGPPTGVLRGTKCRTKKPF